ncbi:MAG: ABC transporter permease [Chloroflexi bacterium]|nr:ABC transporter permease [Chloroflexota bacterium]
MAGYVLQRLAQAAFLLVGVVVLTFVLIHAAPGDPIYALAGESGDAAYYAEMRARYGLDRPLLEQLAIYVTSVLRGDFGHSYVQKQPVFQIILTRLPATLLLLTTALVLATSLGVWLGAEAGRRAGHPVDATIRTGTLLSYSTPAFWLGQILSLIFTAWLGWLPAQGMTSARGDYQGLAYVADVARHLVLPATTLGLLQLALIARLTRAGVREALQEDYTRTARAKGAPTRRVLYGHALPNALLPVVTVVGGQIGTLLTGAVLTEIVFAWPGLGRLLYDATLSRDYPLLMGIFELTAIAVVLVNLTTDVLYTTLDPRVRYR